MRREHKHYISQKNDNNSNQENIIQGKNEYKCDSRIETKNTNYLKKNDNLPNISQNTNTRFKHTNYTSNQIKLSSSVNNNYSSKLNNDTNKNNLNRNIEKEKIIVYREQTPKIKFEEINSLKHENNNLKKKLQNFEELFIQIKNITTNEINEMRKNTYKILIYFFINDECRK